MPGRWYRSGRLAAPLPLFLVTALALPAVAEAHVKWFAPYDVPEQPKPLSQVFSTTYISLFVAGLAGVLILSLLERTALGAAVLRSVERVTAPLRPRIEHLYRGVGAGFFVALFTLHDIILTPELKTSLPVIPWLQLFIAIGMFWRPTMVLSAAGIFALYAYAIYTYGIFHLLDYPIFLGAAVYLALTGLGQERFLGMRPLDISRWGAGITLIWASVEKWAYPQWTDPLLKARPSLCMGFNSHFFMIAAGFVEFFLAYSMLCTPLLRRLAALVLSAMFVSAVLDFGPIDAIGHSMIVAILLGIAVDDQPMSRRAPILAPAYGCVALAGILTAYYGLHALIFGTIIW